MRSELKYINVLLITLISCVLAVGQSPNSDSISWYQSQLDSVLGMDYSLTIDYHKRLVELYRQNNNEPDALIYSAHLIYYLTYDGHYHEARTLGYELLRKVKNNPDKNLDALVYKGLAFYHRLTGNLDIAQEYYDHAMQSALESSDERLITDLMIEMSKMEFALERYQNSLEIAQQVLQRNNLSLLDSANVSQMLGLCHLEMKNLDSFYDVVDYYTPVLSRVNLEGEWKAADLLAQKYKILDQKENRKKEIQRMLDISAAIGNREAKSFKKMGDFYYDQANVAEAITWHKRALEYAHKTDRASDELSSLKALYQDYKSTDQSESTLKYYERYVDMRNSFFERQSQDRIIDRDQQLELEQKEKEISRLSEVKRKADEQKRFLILALVFLSLLLAIGLYSYFRIKNISHHLKESNLKLRKSWEENSTLLKETHHRIKNNLQVISSLINLQRRYVSDEAAQQALLDGRNRIKSISLVHELLYRYDVDEAINMHEYIDKIHVGLWSSYKVSDDRIEFINEVEPMFLLEEHVNSIGLVVNELLTNSLKYAFPDQRSGVITAILKEKNNTLILSIQDDGIGLPDDFNLEENTKTFGLSLLLSMAKKMDAEVTIVSESGTKVELTIKKYTLISAPKREE